MHAFDALVEAWVRERYIPGAVLDIRIGDRFRFSKAYGSYHDNSSSRQVRLQTWFDLASLTKVVATLPAVLSLAKEGRLTLDDPVREHLPEFIHGEVTIRHLLQHTSGLPADLSQPPRIRRAEVVLDSIYQSPLESPPGFRAAYSDLGMILLGLLIERVAEEPLNRAASKRVFGPIGMSRTGFAADLPDLKDWAASTENVNGRYIVGEVHDEKAYALGGVSGSSGLFSVASDLTRYAEQWMNPERSPVLSHELVSECFEQPCQGRALGWEMRHRDQIPLGCGSTWLEGSFGHTGFTGTSLWIEPQTELSVVWLTNAVHYGRHTPIRSLRRTLHDQIRRDLVQ